MRPGQGRPPLRRRGRYVGEAGRPAQGQRDGATRPCVSTTDTALSRRVGRRGYDVAIRTSVTAFRGLADDTATTGRRRPTADDVSADRRASPSPPPAQQGCPDPWLADPTPPGAVIRPPGIGAAPGAPTEPAVRVRASGEVNSYTRRRVARPTVGSASTDCSAQVLLTPPRSSCHDSASPAARASGSAARVIAYVAGSVLPRRRGGRATGARSDLQPSATGAGGGAGRAGHRPAMAGAVKASQPCCDRSSRRLDPHGGRRPRAPQRECAPVRRAGVVARSTPSTRGHIGAVGAAVHSSAWFPPDRARLPAARRRGGRARPVSACVRSASGYTGARRRPARPAVSDPTPGPAVASP